MKEVSVIIPTYNEEDYIEYCIRALRNQNYKGRYEIIVADGGSKDNTVKLARKFADKVVRVKKRGAAAGRNSGAKAAEGKILIFVDADTLAMPNLISEFVKKLRYRDVVGVTCPILPDSMEITHQLFYYLANVFVRYTTWRKKPQVFGICCAYKRDVFEKVNGFNENLKTCEDLELSQRIAQHGKVAFTNKTFAITSVRRIKRWGATKSVGRCVTNYFNYMFFGKSFNLREYRPVRRA